MIRTLFLALLPFALLRAESLDEIMGMLQNNSQLKMAQEQCLSAAEQFASQKGVNYPSLDLLYSATYLYERPVVFLKVPGSTATLQMQSQNQYDGALRLSYALFTGFAATSGIDTARFAMQRSQLEAEDVKRNLYLSTISSYATAVAAKQFVQAQEEALKAIETSLEKAEGMYEQGMLPPSALYRIEASLHETQAGLSRSKNQYLSALNALSYLAGKSISKVSKLPKYQDIDEDELLKSALQKRPDLQALKKIHSAKESLTRLKKSSYYPSLTLFAQLAQHGDDVMLDGDGYTNKDRSAAGFLLNYNLFEGFKTSHDVEAARKEELSAQWMIRSYEEMIRKEIKESCLVFSSLKSELKANKAQLKAREAYYQLVQGEFDNQLSDADLLSRAISALSAARSSLAATQARLYAAYARILLQVDIPTFQEASHSNE